MKIAFSNKGDVNDGIHQSVTDELGKGHKNNERIKK